MNPSLKGMMCFVSSLKCSPKLHSLLGKTQFLFLLLLLACIYLSSGFASVFLSQVPVVFLLLVVILIYFDLGFKILQGSKGGEKFCNNPTHICREKMEFEFMLEHSLFCPWWVRWEVVNCELRDEDNWPGKIMPFTSWMKWEQVKMTRQGGRYVSARLALLPRDTGQVQ